MVRAYLDHNATAPLRPEARRAVEEELARPAANPSSVHREGARARSVIDEARRSVASLIGASPHEIVFTASGTEALNLAVKGSAHTLRDRGRRMAALAIEHPAVLEPLEQLRSDGWTIDVVPVDRTGRVRISDVAAALHPDTVLLAAMWANNETGIVQPVADIARLCASRGVRLLVDATQAAGRIAIGVRDTAMDLLVISSHKIGGPSGAGALYVREGTRLEPHTAGGGQESGLRGGTEDVLTIAGFGAAARAAGAALDSEVAIVSALRDHLVSAVLERVPAARLVGEGERLPNTAQFLVPYDDEELLILALDRAGFAVSSGSACAAGAHVRSHVLEAMGLLERGVAAVRVSLGATNTIAEIDAFARALARCTAPAQVSEEVPS